jgi:hypothetical protein
MPNLAQQFSLVHTPSVMIDQQHPFYLDSPPIFHFFPSLHHNFSPSPSSSPRSYGTEPFSRPSPQFLYILLAHIFCNDEDFRRLSGLFIVILLLYFETRIRVRIRIRIRKGVLALRIVPQQRLFA